MKAPIHINNRLCGFTDSPDFAPTLRDSRQWSDGKLFYCGDGVDEVTWLDIRDMPADEGEVGDLWELSCYDFHLNQWGEMLKESPYLQDWTFLCDWKEPINGVKYYGGEGFFDFGGFLLSIANGATAQKEWGNVQ